MFSPNQVICGRNSRGDRGELHRALAVTAELYATGRWDGRGRIVIHDPVDLHRKITQTMHLGDILVGDYNRVKVHAALYEHDKNFEGVQYKRNFEVLELDAATCTEWGLDPAEHTLEFGWSHSILHLVVYLDQPGRSVIAPDEGAARQCVFWHITQDRWENPIRVWWDSADNGMLFVRNAHVFRRFQAVAFPMHRIDRLAYL